MVPNIGETRLNCQRGGGRSIGLKTIADRSWVEFFRPLSPASLLVQDFFDFS
jgi:hypothetical protein